MPPKIKRPEAPAALLRCATAACKYFNRTCANRCSIFPDNGCRDCRDFTPTPKKKGTQK